MTGEGGSWLFDKHGVSAQGCTGGANGGACFDAVQSVALTNDMLFQVDLVGGSFSQTLAPTLKARFLDSQGWKEGSLIGQQMTLVSSGVDPFVTISAVPEPTSLALLGTGLLALGLVSRKKQSIVEAVKA